MVVAGWNSFFKKDGYGSHSFRPDFAGFVRALDHTMHGGPCLGGGSGG